MAIISCPRCGGAGEELSTGLKCRFCKGAKRVEVDEEEIKAWLRVSHAEKKSTRFNKTSESQKAVKGDK